MASPRVADGESEKLPKRRRSSVGDIVKNLSNRADALLMEPDCLSEADARSFGALTQKTLAQIEFWKERSSKADGGSEPYQAFIARVLECDLPLKLLVCLQYLDFEAQKVTAFILSDLLSGAEGIADGVAEYVQSTPLLARRLLDLCSHADLFFLGSQIISAASRCPQVVSALLKENIMVQLLRLCFHQNFEICSEAFATLREVMLKQKRLAADYVEANFDEFFKLYHPLLQREEHYMVQRQALKLLGVVLMDGDGAFRRVMVRYSQTDGFLKLHMKLLLHRSRMIPVDTFHIFKLFVANPRKPRSVQAILHRNSMKLVQLLDKLRYMHNDDSFQQDIDVVLDMLDDLSSS